MLFFLQFKRNFELIEPQLSVLARLCVYCIVSALEIKPSKAKRTSNGNESNDNESRPTKVRKMNDSPFELSASRNTPTNDSNTSSSTLSSSSTTNKIREPLRICLQNLFQTLYQLTFSNELTPKVIFVHHFLNFLHRCGGNRIKPILNLIPNNLMKNLLKIMNVNEFNYDFILK